MWTESSKATTFDLNVNDRLYRRGVEVGVGLGVSFGRGLRAAGNGTEMVV